MTSASVASLGRVESRRPLITSAGWCWIAGLTLLFIFVHGTYLERLFRIVTHASGDNIFELLWSAASSRWNADWSHALIVPLISIYYIYQHRARLAMTRPRVWFPALPLMFLGLLSYAFWVFPGRNDMFQGYSMLLTLFGLVLFVLGPDPMRVLWFPIAFLVFGVKIADSLWDRIAWQLQQIASGGAEYALKFFTAFLDFDVARQGTTLKLIFVKGGVPIEESLNVAEACSGLRSLMAFVALGTALAFLWERPWWQRIVMVLMSVPIAVGVNIARVTVLGLLYLVDPKYAHGDFHTMIGMLMLIPAAGLFILLGWIMDQVIVRDENDEPASPARGASPAVGAAVQAPETDSHDDDPFNDYVRASAVLGIAFVSGAVAMAAAGGVYLLAFVIGAPGEDLPGMAQMLVLMPWLVVPAGIVGSGVCLAAWKALSPMIRRLPSIAGVPAVRVTAVAITAGVFVTLSVGQTAVVNYLDMVLIKKPVPLRHPLVMIPAEAGSWTLDREDPPLPRAQLEELGTEQYISRIYVDTQWPSNKPGGVVRLHVAYYTGTTDTVPHVPDRCFVAGGVQGLDKGLIGLKLSGSQYQPDPVHGGFLVPVQTKRTGAAQPPARVPTTDIGATYFTFSPGGGRTDNVVYFFAANGDYLATPNDVRATGFDAQDQYSYYCKVEVQMPGVADKDVAAERASAFLSAMLPEIMACLPDWVDVEQGRWPAEDVQKQESRKAADQNGDTGPA